MQLLGERLRNVMLAGNVLCQHRLGVLVGFTAFLRRIATKVHASSYRRFAGLTNQPKLHLQNEIHTCWLLLSC